MDTNMLIWIIVAVVVILVVVGIAIFMSRKRGHARVEADRRHAAELRSKAQEADLAAREREAQATKAQADAQQAQVDAERLARESAERQAEAQRVRAESAEQLQKADQLDPDVDTRGGGGTRRADDVSAVADDRRPAGATDPRADGRDDRRDSLR